MAGNDFVERSIMGALNFLKESVFSEEHAGKNALLQKVNPRLKVIFFLSLLTAVLFSQNILALAGLYFFCLLLAVLSRIKIAYFLKRTWVFIPLFSLFIAIPALFSFITPGEPLAFFHLAGFKLTITRQGLGSALLFVTRVATSVSLVVLLNLTIRQAELLRSLRIFGVPQIFVMTLSMCYRYIFLFAEIIEHTYTGIKSRVGTSLHYKKGQHIVAWKIASLWERSSQLNEEVYNAMLSRGYTGEPKVLDK